MSYKTTANKVGFDIDQIVYYENLINVSQKHRKENMSN